VQKLAEVFNRKYGLNITVNYHPTGGMTGDVAKVVGRAAAGVPPEWDSMVLHDGGHATLWLRKLHQPFDYRKLGVDPKLIHYDNGTVSLANQLRCLPITRKSACPGCAEKLGGSIGSQVEGGEVGHVNGNSPSRPVGDCMG
jgi:hypothetical protein